MKTDILLCGVGGQGTVLASRLLAFIFMEKGLNVRTAETIGMAQRGGCVVSHMRAGEKIASPMIPKKGADVIIAFEPAEAVRCIDYLKDGGLVIVNKKAVKPVTASLSGSDYDGVNEIEFLKNKAQNVFVIDGDEICSKCGNSKVLNTVLLAAAVKSGKLGISEEEFKDAIKKMLPERFVELNLKAVEAV